MATKQVRWSVPPAGVATKRGALSANMLETPILWTWELLLTPKRPQQPAIARRDLAGATLRA